MTRETDMHRRRRLQTLAQTSALTPRGPHSSRDPVASASGLSVEHLRQAIRRIERSIESPLIESADAPERVPLVGVEDEGDKVENHQAIVKLRLSDAQTRMASCLNRLPVKKYVTWYPEVTNSHSVIVVRYVYPEGTIADSQGSQAVPCSQPWSGSFAKMG